MVALSIITLLYGFFIIVYTIGWLKLKKFDTIPGEKLNIHLTVIIPMRNEESSITYLLDDIKKQTFAKDQFEVIIIDDSSTDQSVNVCEDFIKDNPALKMQLMLIKQHAFERAYKKDAISKAIEQAKGDLIITTDADCRVHPDWLKLIAAFYVRYRYKMIVGPVKFASDSNIFDKAQSLEFISLIGISGGAVNVGWPLMCNGANLAYEKEAFWEVEGYEKDSFSSGDDLFLLMKIRRKFGARAIGFLKNQYAFVATGAQKDVKSFINQRTRWASKNKSFQIKIVVVAFVVFLMNLAVLLTFISAVMSPNLWIQFLIIFGFKLLLDFPLLLSITSFIGERRLLWLFLPLTLVYPFYIVYTGVAGIFGSYEWKGRKISK